MKATYDPEAKALYIYTDVEDKEVAGTTPVWRDDISYNIDLNQDRKVVGFEFLGLELEELKPTYLAQCYRDKDHDGEHFLADEGDTSSDVRRCWYQKEVKR